jgi:hypothetical protein
VSTAAATLSLPTAPANQSMVAVKPLTPGYASPAAPTPYAVTVQCGGSDTIDKTSVSLVQLFAVCDAGITNMASYGVCAPAASTRISGDLGIIDPRSANHGLVSAAAGVWKSASGDSTGG